MTVPGGATSSLAKKRYKYAISRAIKQHDLQPLYWRSLLKKFQVHMSGKGFVDVLGQYKFGCNPPNAHDLKYQFVQQVIDFNKKLGSLSDNEKDEDEDDDHDHEGIQQQLADLEHFRNRYNIAASVLFVRTLLRPFEHSCVLFVRTLLRPFCAHPAASNAVLLPHTVNVYQPAA